MRCCRPLVFIAAALIPALRGSTEGARLPTEPVRVMIPMRDGVRLAANLFHPPGGGRLPTILLRTPYDKGTKITPQLQAYVDHGYNVVNQDVRGRAESEGVFSPLWQEPGDGDDTINWIAAQPWSDGKVGMTGGSYLGFVQWKVAVWNNPHLKAIFPVVSGDDDYRDKFYSPGGAMKWGHRLEWIAENMHAPGYQPPPFQQYIWTVPERRAERVVTGENAPLLVKIFEHPAFDGFWKSISVRERLKYCKVPVFSVGGWYDNYVEGDLDAYASLRKYSGLNRIVIGPWPHNMSEKFPNYDFGPGAPQPLRKFQLDWFDEWLKGKEVPAEQTPPVRIFVMGANYWRDENEWPLARAIPTKLYLESKGRANSLNGQGVLREKAPHRDAADHYTYDPHNPVRTMGGAVCCNPKVFPWGPMDQRPVESRGDVLVYTTGALKDDVEVTGPISVVLYAATSAPDTDFTAKLVDVYPDGRAINLTDGILRTRYRDGLDQPKLLKETGPVRYIIDAGVTSNVFRKGHSIRLEISSSNFPRFDRNPNTGRPIADETELVKATQTIYHDRLHASYLAIPVIPPKALVTQTRVAEPRI